VDDVEAFVEQLVVLGRSSYTIRTYQLGVQHFREWLKPRSLDEVTRSIVAEYLADFAAGPGRVAGKARAPRTINHRVAALAAFFGFLIERDTRRAAGPWFDRKNPVPTSAGGPSHGMPGRDLPRRSRLEMRRALSLACCLAI
jgi:site-specific recombinase XerD